MTTVVIWAAFSEKSPGVVIEPIPALEVSLDCAAQFEASEGHLRGPSQPLPTWVRPHFRLFCPSCEVSQEFSTQTNAVRARRVRCDCGQELYTDAEAPSISLKEPRV